MAQRPKPTSLHGIEARRKHFLRKRQYADAFDARDYPDIARNLRACEETDSLVGCQHCGASWWVTTRCRSRVCPLCSFHESKKRAKYLLAMTSHMAHPKLVTLTMELWEGDPREGIRYLRKHVTQMRRSELFKPVVGGAYQIELKQKENGWHIHIHLLLDAPYIPYQKLFSKWKELTEQKYVSIDIRSAKTPEARAYVVKYPSKSAAFDTHPEAIVDWYEATKGLRLFATFGKWFNAKLNELDPETPAEDKGIPCPHCGNVKTIFFIRDGPLIFGHDIWKSIADEYTKGRPTLRTVAGVCELLAPRRGPHAGEPVRDPIDPPFEPTPEPGDDEPW